MNVQVVYHSKGGNTRKVAEAVAKSLQTTAKSVDKIKNTNNFQADLLVIGDGMYGGGISGEMKKFLSSVNAKNIKHAAVFSTSGGSWWFGPSSIKKRLRKMGVSVCDESFRCHGAAFGFLFKSHPDEADLKKAQEFAQDAKRFASK